LNQSLPDFFNLVDSHFITMLLYDSTHLAINGDQVWAVGWATAQEKESREFRIAADGLCCARKALVCSLAGTCLITSNFCCDGKISKQHCPLTFTLSWTITTPIFDTATDIVTDLLDVEHVDGVGNRRQDVIYSLPDTVDRFANDVWFNCDQVIISCVPYLNKKIHFPCFRVLPRSTEALVSGKIKHLLIAYFLCNFLPTIVKIGSRSSKL